MRSAELLLENRVQTERIVKAVFLEHTLNKDERIEFRDGSDT